MNTQSSPTSSAAPSLLRDTRGLSTVEYIILLVLLAAASITLWNDLGAAVRAKLSESTDQVNGMNTDGSSSPF